MIAPRQRTRLLDHVWPFLYSVDPKRGLVLNVVAEAKPVTPRVVLLPDVTTQPAWPFSVKTQQQALLDDLGEAPF